MFKIFKNKSRFNLALFKDDMGSLNRNINFKKIAKEVIDLEIKALQKLKKL